MVNARRIGLVMAACIAAAVVAGCGGSSPRGEGPSPSTEPPTSQAAGTQLYEGEFTVLADKSHGPHLCRDVATSLPPQCSGLPVTNWNWDEVQGEERVRGTIWGGWHVTGTYSDGKFTLVGAPTEPVPDSDEPDGNGLTPEPDFSPACDEPSGESTGVAEWEQLAQTGGRWPTDPRIVTVWVTDPRGSAGGDEFVVNLLVRPGAKEEIEAKARRTYRGLLCVVERDLPTEAELAAIQSEVTDDAARQRLGVTSAWSEGQRGVVVVTVWVVTDVATDYARERWGDVVELHGYLTPVD
jgi:hypothetical protein